MVGTEKVSRHNCHAASPFHCHRTAYLRHRVFDRFNDRSGASSATSKTPPQVFQSICTNLLTGGNLPPPFSAKLNLPVLKDHRGSPFALLLG